MNIVLKKHDLRGRYYRIRQRIRIQEFKALNMGILLRKEMLAEI